MDQTAANEAAVAAVQEFLGGPTPDGERWTFELGEHLTSVWGGIYGGATAAATLAVGRLAAPDRSPRTLHVQMVRSLPAGPTVAAARVRRVGRAVTTVEVELLDQRQRLAALAILTSVAPDELAQAYRNVDAVALRADEEPGEAARARRQAFSAPILASLQAALPRKVTNIPPSITDHEALVARIEPPWDDLSTTGPELSCLVGDMANGTPITSSLDLLGPVSFPNTDLTLRFASAVGDRPVYATSTLVAVEAGTTTVSIQVQAGGRLLAHGQSTSVLIP